MAKGASLLTKLWNIKNLQPASVVKSHSPVNYPRTYINNVTANWISFKNQLDYLKCYEENPIGQAVVNIKADAWANMQFFVKDLRTLEEIPLIDYDADKGQLRDLLAQPNPLQSGIEWLQQWKVNYEVFNNGYSFAFVPLGFENRRFTYQEINVINNLPPYAISPQLTGKWLKATEKDEIIAFYKLQTLNGRTEKLPTNTVFHMNGVNIKMDRNFTEGVSKYKALQRPLTNIQGAYESRNVMIHKRGALGILSPKKTDEFTGDVPLTQEEIKQTQEEFDKYGTLENQFQQIFSPRPLEYTKMAQSVKNLMLFEEVSHDAITVANSFGVPESLLRNYIRTGTLGTESDVDEKRLYTSTIIPETKDFVIGLNNFLKTRDHNIELIGSYDHLDILQANKKEEAETMSLKERTALSAFKIGSTKYNDYLTAINMPLDSEIGEKRIWELEPKQLNAIGIPTNTAGNGEE